MLLKPDHVRAVHAENERRLAALHLERAIRQARAERTKAIGDGVGQGAHLLARLAAMFWNRIRRGVPTYKPTQRWQTLPNGK